MLHCERLRDGGGRRCGLAGAGCPAGPENRLPPAWCPPLFFIAKLPDRLDRDRRNVFGEIISFK